MPKHLQCPAHDTSSSDATRLQDSELIVEHRLCIDTCGPMTVVISSYGAAAAAAVATVGGGGGGGGWGGGGGGGGPLGGKGRVTCWRDIDLYAESRRDVAVP